MLISFITAFLPLAACKIYTANIIAKYYLHQGKGQLVNDLSDNENHAVNGRSLDIDSFDVDWTGRGAHFLGNKGLWIAPSSISQTGILLSRHFTITLWLLPININMRSFIRKDNVFEVEIGQYAIQGTYQSQSLSTLNLNEQTTNAWGFLTIVHEYYSSVQHMRILYNDISISLNTFSVSWTDSYSNEFILGVPINALSFRGFIYDTFIYDIAIPYTDIYSGSAYLTGGSCVYPIYEGACISTCESADSDNDCNLCDGCTACGVSPTDCIECTPGCDDICSESECIDMADICSPFAYNSVAFACDFVCTSNCLVCPDNVCQECSSGFILQLDLTCEATCPIGYFDLNGRCEKCHEDCDTCVGLYYYDCLSCSNQNSYLFASPGPCSCSSGFYEESSDPLVCRTCHSDCSTCTGPLSSDCLTCTNSDKSIMSSLCRCNWGLVQNTQDSEVCEACDESCKTCTGQGSDKCSSCLTSEEELIDGQCICISGYFRDSSNSNQCSPCSSSCSLCSGSSENCITCYETGQVEVDGECECQTGYYQSSTSPLVCKQCSTSCSTCSGPLSTDCESCTDPNAYIKDGKCLCVQGYYASSSSPLICTRCSEYCNACTSQKCIVCFDKNAIANENCECKEGYYRDSTCKSCHSSCKRCKGSLEEDCLSCKDDQKEPVEGKCRCKSGLCENGDSCEECLSPRVQKLGTEAKVSTGGLAGAIALGFISKITLDDPTVMWTITSIAQFLSYLPLLGVDLSSTLYEYFLSYKTLLFVPNFMLDMIPEDDSDAPIAFREYGHTRNDYTDTQLFRNAGVYISVFLVLAGAMTVILLISLVVSDVYKQKLRNADRKLLGFTLKLWFQLILDILVPGTVYVFGNSSNSNVFLDVSSKLICTFCIVSPLIFWALLLEEEKIKEEDERLMAYLGSLFKSMNLNGKYSLHHEGILTIRRICYAFSIYCFYDYPMVVLVSQIVFSIGLCMFYMKGKAFEKKRNNIINSMAEIVFVLTMVAVIIIHKTENKAILEYGIIGLNSFFIIGISVLNIIILFVNYIKKKKEKQHVVTKVINSPDINVEVQNSRQLKQNELFVEPSNNKSNSDTLKVYRYNTDNSSILQDIRE